MSLTTGSPHHVRTAGSFGAFTTPLHVGLALAALSALFVALWPLGLAGDYLNHLARNHIEAHVWFDQALRQNYYVALAPIPDLAMDMVIPWLAHITGTYNAGAVMIWVALAAPPLAGLLLARTLHGRVTWMSLLGFLAVYNGNVQWGFVNFVVATGLAVAGFALWIRLSPSWRRTAILAPFGVFLVLCHAFGFLLLGYLALLWEVACFARNERRTAALFLRQLATRDAAAMLPGLALLAATTGSAGELTHLGTIDFSLAPKFGALLSGAEFFNTGLATLVTIALACGAWIGLRSGLLRIEPRMAWVCAGMLALVIVMPTSILGIWGLHFRFPAVLVLLAAASMTLSPDADDRLRSAITVGAAALLLAVQANGAVQMARIDRHAGTLRTVLENLPEGTRVLPARDEATDPLLVLHAAGMAVVEASAYVPNLFTNTSPVGVVPAMRPLHMPQAWPLLGEQLAGSAGRALPPSRNGFWSPAYYFGWPEHWDYVLYFRVAPGSVLELEPLCAKAEAPTVVLYRISDNGCRSVDVSGDPVKGS